MAAAAAVAASPMAAKVEVITVAASLTVSVPELVVEQNVGYLPWVLGENLAGQVDGYVMEQGLGYYPALDFFRDHPEAVDPALLQLIDEVAVYCADYARRELRRRLTPAFSSVQFEQVQCLAYTMPRMRPSRNNSPAALAQHYSPDSLKLQLLLGTIQKGHFAGEERLALEKVSRLGRQPFAQFQLNGAQRVEG